MYIHHILHVGCNAHPGARIRGLPLPGSLERGRSRPAVVSGSWRTPASRQEGLGFRVKSLGFRV